jgi:hypothetical protein
MDANKIGTVPKVRRRCSSVGRIRIRKRQAIENHLLQFPVAVASAQACNRFGITEVWRPQPFFCEHVFFF